MSPIRIPLDDGQDVSALLTEAKDAFALLVLAHGAGAGMTHPFMAAIAAGLAAQGVSTLRYQFPSMEAGKRRPDTPAVAHRTVRAAVAAARQTGLPLFAGGKSFGGRMTSQAQAAAPLPGIRGLVFLGYPLHPAAKPSTERARHLADVHIPMLFLQGTNDALAELHLLTETTARLQAATLSLIDDADHSFHVPVRSGRSDAEILDHLCLIASRWMRAALST